MSKFIKCLKFLCMPLFLLGLLFVGQSASAIEPDAGVVYAYAGSGGVSTSCNYGWTTSMCSPTNPSLSGFSFYPTSAINLTVGSYWLEAFVTFSSNGTTDAPLIVGIPTYSPEGTIISFESVSSTTRGSTTVRIYRLIMKWSGGTVINSSNPINISNSSAWVNSAGYMVNSFTFYKETTNTDATNQQIINAINNLNSTMQSNTPPSADDIASAITEDEQQATQDAADASDTAGSSAASSAQSGTSNLLGIIGQFIDTLKNITPSTCTLNLDAGHLVLGNVDFCQLSPPAGITALFSVIAVFFFIPLAWSTVSQIIDMFRSFTNG